MGVTDQKSREWFNSRVGKVTASRVGDAMRKLQRASNGKKAGDWHGDHDKYVRELFRELRYGKPAWHRTTWEMDYGTEYEPEARKAYAKYIGQEVKQVGFVLHPRLSYLGASPDGLVGEDGGVEIKVPAYLTNHIDNLLDEVIPEEYIPQMQCNMLCTGRSWWDFVSYSPAPEGDEERCAVLEEDRLFVKRLEFDPDYRLQKDGPTIEEAATATIEEAVALVQKLSERRPLQVNGGIICPSI